MIKNPIATVIVLLLIEVVVLFFAGHPRFKKYFTFLPHIFWIYFLPIVASTFGILDNKNPVYSLVSQNFLPASLFLLLICVDLKMILRLGKPALIMFLAGGLGIMIGNVVVFFLFKEWVGPQFWSGFGTLSASWMGGSANMLAVKEALGTPDDVFLPMVVVDTIVPYTWMGILVALSIWQKPFDQWNLSRKEILEDINQRVSSVKMPQEFSMRWYTTIMIVVMALTVSIVIQKITYLWPVIEGIISHFTWVVIAVSLLGLGCSFTPLKKLERNGSTKIGYFLLYFVLTSVGAKASIEYMQPLLVILIIAGFLIIFIHAIILIAVGRLIRAPMFLVAVSSQANVGGVASAPIVAEIYQPGLAAIGLLMAILGNIIGTYFGIATGQVCRLIAGI